MISPLASIHPEAKIGADVEIGPFVFIDKDVEIGDGCIIDSNATLCQYTKLGKHCVPFCCDRCYPAGPQVPRRGDLDDHRRQLLTA